MYLDLSVEELCGQLIVGGFEGTELPGDLGQALAAGERAGAILFKRNLETPAQAADLCGAIAETAPPDLPPFIGVDEEGGRVSRLPDESLRLPPMRAVGATGDTDLARRTGQALGRVLGALGFNLDFAPVLDVDSNPKNPIIGDRSFSRDPAEVARLGRAFASGLIGSGVMTCGKHFPGHGDTHLDSHLDLPHVAHDLPRLRRVELKPFSEVGNEVVALMSAHVVYAALDPLVPATLSRAICTDLLRRQLSFEGVLFSDDLEMRAVADRLPIEHTAVQAIDAGCDTLLICKDFSLQERAQGALVQRAKTDTAFRDRCVEAVERSIRARRRFPPPHPRWPDEAAAGALRDVIAEICAHGRPQ
jgi:beta-N-acetylhexosaminidase